MRKTSFHERLKKREKNIHKLLEALNKGFISGENADSTQETFFTGDKKDQFNIDFKPVSGLPQSLNRNIIEIYNIIGNPLKELYLGEWTIMSAVNAIKRYEELCELGRRDIFDIGYKYMGMGHITVLACDLNDHLLFYRPDGGSNGYDRENNLNNLIKYGATDYEKFYFYKWFYNINFSID